jgi:hypothetical protein
MESPAEETPDAPVIEPGLNGGDAQAGEPVGEPAAEDPVVVEAPEAEQAETARGPVAPAPAEEPAGAPPADPAPADETTEPSLAAVTGGEADSAEAGAASHPSRDEDGALDEQPSSVMPEQVAALSGEDERALAEVLRTAIAEEAERLAASTRYAESAQGFRDLLERWKSAPSAGQMRDRELWRRFAAAREAFYEQRNRAYAERARERTATVERKEALIAASEALASSNDGRAIGDALERLMTEWKAAGHAGRDQEQALWERFSASRRAAFDRRRSMAAERDRQRGGARAAKRALIEQAQALIERHNALTDTLERARHYGAMARDALGLFRDSPLKSALLEAVDFAIDRAH